MGAAWGTQCVPVLLQWRRFKFCVHKIVVDQDAVDSVKWWRFGFSL